MSVTTPAMGTASATSGRTWYRFVRRLALRASSELALVYVPDGVHEQLAVLKRLPPAHTADAAAVAKFRREARIAARLEHPSIVRVFDVVESSREDFYTMEYVRGADMRQLMDALSAQGRTLPLDCVLLIALEVCNALDYAHHLTDDRGKPAPVIHRELSPSKVLVGVDGAIKLTGFGAPPVEQSAALRRSRTASVSYTSPERALGEGVDARSDVFA
ncbi:MAG TPA: protein kinase, partial [Kofleriaceae bacterium]|nr:protein kinase [Kofleriaceae bacterium]